MRKTGKIIDFTPYEEVKDKNGVTVMSKKDGLAVLKRQVVVDCSYMTDNGDEIREGYVCDMYNEMDDSRLEQLRSSGEKVAFYIHADFYKTDNGYYFQKITLKRINLLN